MKDLFKQLDELRGKNPCGIYLLKINGKQYVGSSVNIKKRLRRHRTLLRNNKHDNKYLQNMYNKYKACEYSILEECDSLIEFLELRIKERQWVNKLNAELNLDDPVQGIGGFHEKTVYQFDLEGKLITEWKSAMIAARTLDVSHNAIHACANPSVSESKSAHGFQWSYERDSPGKYVCNTGSNLETRPVYLYTLDGNFFMSFDSLSDCARYVATDINYQGDWKIIRSNLAYVLQKPQTRKVRRRYLASYTKADTHNLSLSTGS